MASSQRSDLKAQSTIISNGIGSLHREHYGRGADRIRTWIHADHVITVLEDCFTPVERKMVSEGAFTQVRDTRIMFQDWMSEIFIDIVEQTTGRKVRSFFSQVAHDPDVAIELFLFEPSDTSNGGPPKVRAEPSVG